MIVNSIKDLTDCKPSISFSKMFFGKSLRRFAVGLFLILIISMVVVLLLSSFSLAFAEDKEVAKGVGHKKPSTDGIRIYDIEGEMKESQSHVTGRLVIIENEESTLPPACILTYTYFDKDIKKMTVKSIFFGKLSPDKCIGENILKPQQTITINFYNFKVILWEINQPNTSTPTPTPREQMAGIQDGPKFER